MMLFHALLSASVVLHEVIFIFSIYRNCGKSFCSSHSPESRRILRFGHTSPVRVCHDCAYSIDSEAFANQLEWKEMRVKALLVGRLIPYNKAHIIDRGVDKAMR